MADTPRLKTSQTAESIALATNLPAASVRAVRNNEDVPVADRLKVGGFLGFTVDQMFGDAA